jgi:hypothetical protein
MVSNNRIYWACQGVAMAPQDSATFTAVHGLQSMGITTTFNLEQVFEIGQLAIYENIEAIPDIEITMEKVLDGWPLIYHLATRGYASNTLAGRSARKCNVILNIYDDTAEAASGVPQTEVFMSGMYISSISYSLPVDGNCTESVTLVGNNKLWKTASFLKSDNFLGTTAGSDMPDVNAAGIVASGGVQRRENVLFGNGAYGTYTKLPNEIQGISTSGTNNMTAGVLGAHIQTMSVSCDLGREALNELGRRGPYFRYVNFPVEVTCEIETTSAQGDRIDATEAGIGGSGYNLIDQEIYIVMQDSTKINLGTRNKLASVSYGGADAGGGNATVTYSYTTFNDFVVTQNSDPVS